MKKEIWICLIILILICIGNYITQKYTKHTSEELISKLEDLKGELINKEDKKEEANQKEIDSKLSQIEKEWNTKNDKLAYFIEHDELEKVETNLINLRSLVENQMYNDSIKELDETKYGLKHIEEKYAFNLKNIF